MKKLLSLLLVVLALFAFCACGSEEREIYLDGNETATIVIYNDSVTKYTVRLSALEEPTVISAMEYLNEKKDVALTYTTSVEYGAYVTEFGELKEDAKSYQYIMFWTSIESDWDVSAYATENRFNGVKLVSSGVGASTAKLEDGAVIFFAYMGTDATVDEKGFASIVIHSEEDTEYTVGISELEAPTVICAMDYLNKEKGVALTYTTSLEYGAYVTEFGALKEDAANYKYIMFWTSIESDWDVSSYATEKEYKGVQLVSSGLGVSTASLENGSVVYFAIVAY